MSTLYDVWNIVSLVKSKMCFVLMFLHFGCRTILDAYYYKQISPDKWSIFVQILMFFAIPSFEGASPLQESQKWECSYGWQEAFHWESRTGENSSKSKFHFVQWITSCVLKLFDDIVLAWEWRRL